MFDFTTKFALVAIVYLILSGFAAITPVIAYGMALRALYIMALRAPRAKG